MNEGRTSAIFAAIAAISFGLAWMSRPEAVSDESDLKRERVGQMVFGKFEDPGEAASFQIVKYDESLGQLERFEVAKDRASSMWKLPSYEDYPADAAEQVRDATTPLIGLPILNVSSLDRGDHSLYGVLDPDSEALSVGESGVGMLLRVKNNSDQVLAELVVGKEVVGAEGQRYVRIPTEDATYVVELNTAPFTTDFNKWIKQELLEVRNFDISNVDLRDYAIIPTQGGYGMSRNFDADLAFDSSANEWNLDRLVTYENGKAEETTLPEGQELNATVLNDLRNAIQDLQIVNVRRKPTGLAADLKADKSLMENKQSLQSLVSQGFIPQEGVNGTEIFATGGETLIGTQAGVKYLLRFGEVVAKLSGSGDDEEESGLRRYLLVSAALDDSKFPPPDLEPLPETVEEMLAAQNPASAADISEATDTVEPATSQNSEDTEKTSEPNILELSEPAATLDDEGVPAPEAANKSADNDEVDVEESANAADESAADDSNSSPAVEDASSQSSEDQAEKSREELEEELEFVRERISKENQRKIDERNDRLDIARKRVQELNARFADWYFVVSDNVYRKLKVSRDQLTKPAGEPTGQPAAMPNFNFQP